MTTLADDNQIERYIVPNHMVESSYKLLVVDDDESSRDLLVRHLRSKGYKNVEVAEDGLDCLDKINSNNYDVVLLDIRMPGKSGIEVLKHMQKDMKTKEIPVIMISGANEIDSVIQCIELGAVDFIPKPINPVLLQARLEASIEKKRLRDQQIKYNELLREEVVRSDSLLNVILPYTVASELKTYGKVTPKAHQSVAVLFCDIVDFTAFCNKKTPEEVVGRLQEMFEAFEEIVVQHSMEKIKTTGDEFMATAGLTLANDNQLLSAVSCGLDMVKASKRINRSWNVRVGISQGTVIAGVVGRDRFQFDVWGDAVNTASRMTKMGSVNSVTVPLVDWMCIQSECEARSQRKVRIKGKGLMDIVEVYDLRRI